MIKWKLAKLIGDITIIHSNTIKNLAWGYFEIVEYKCINNISVYIREPGDFRLDDGELRNIEDAKALCEDYLLKVKND